MQTSRISVHKKTYVRMSVTLPGLFGILGLNRVVVQGHSGGRRTCNAWRLFGAVIALNELVVANRTLANSRFRPTPAPRSGTSERLLVPQAVTEKAEN